jgi:bifunctional non-homologous end joining protein LigD
MPTLQAEYPVTVNRLDKILYPEANVSKKDVIEYSIQMQSILLPHLRNRPLTTIRYPDGIHAPSFFQKNIPPSAPDWVKTYREWSDKSGRYIEYILADTVSTLIWLANQACLEWHVGFNTLDSTDSPTCLAFDLDPSVEGFDRVVEVAMFIRDVLDSLDLPSIPKTSGATGLQLFVPIAPGFTYSDTRKILHFVARYAVEKIPKLATIERSVKERGNKVYIDYLQHAPHKTLIAPYSLRAVPLACVSTPLTWSELENGARPEHFTIHTVPSRLQRIGDPFAPLLKPGVDLSYLLRQLPDV